MYAKHYTFVHYVAAVPIYIYQCAYSRKSSLTEMLV